ncbi:hypothetical protein CDD82_7560 [Ophiocordyceps australis]|uniref:Small secreted protein n=1 Tax=Ophiocordyceps australis TaxID=1399860 RepID=A0A2C5YQA3_9HYPO|nr:hypothetical protein CDD82_7560 [Ophiocordyceps australis]
MKFTTTFVAALVGLAAANPSVLYSRQNQQAVQQASQFAQKGSQGLKNAADAARVLAEKLANVDEQGSIQAAEQLENALTPTKADLNELRRIGGNDLKIPEFIKIVQLGQKANTGDNPDPRRPRGGANKGRN